jgi:hypothetical protein
MYIITVKFGYEGSIKSVYLYSCGKHEAAVPLTYKQNLIPEAAQQKIATLSLLLNQPRSSRIEGVGDCSPAAREVSVQITKDEALRIKVEDERWVPF